MGLVCHCDIAHYNYFARKNYFYPDLPKGYQVSQHTTPICKNGYVSVQSGGAGKKISLTRIHLEEDAGKSLHDVSDDYTCLDYNRAGVPLIEIVSEPDIRSAEEAYAYVTEVRKLVRWIGICDGNMEEGSLRCDANISVRLKGEEKLGTKVEVKNLNSIRNVKKAIEVETARLIKIVENGGTVMQETRSFDASNDTTFAIRTKEDADDYRYFPEPDLTPFHFTDEFIQEIKMQLPALPEELMNRYINEFKLPEYDARVICESKETADYFESIIQQTAGYKAAANWLLGPLKSYCNENNLSFSDIRVNPANWVKLIEMIESGKVNFSAAAQKILPVLMQEGNTDPLQLATKLDMLQDSGTDVISQWIEEALAKMPDKVAEYRKGKKGLIGLFVGEVKKISRGKADPKLTNDLLLEKLNQL
jgi:aspartyl-tRNA(Asn)/glutamyl-tRNA(Gln) amidotransferase subunit B